jgi:hypothetical protein
LTEDTDTRHEQDVRDRVELIFENYSLEDLLEMNDLTEQEAIYLLYMEGHISEPESYFP